MRMALRSSTYKMSAKARMKTSHESGMIYLIIQASQKTVVDISTPPFVYHQSSETTLQSVDAAIHGDTWGIFRSTRRTCFAATAPAVPPLFVCGLLLVLLHLRIEVLDDALQLPQSIHKLAILRFSRLSWRATWPWVYAFDLRSRTICARVLLVALYLALATSDARSGIRRPAWSADATIALLDAVVGGRRMQYIV